MFEIEIHLIEIKYRIYYIFYTFCFNFIIIYYKFEIILLYILKPLQIKFIYTHIIELFLIKLFLIIGICILLILPILLYQYWLFIIPGLYFFEKKIYTYKLIIFYITINLIFIINTKYIFPFFYNFFLKWNNNITNLIIFLPKINEYLSFYLYITALSYISIFIPIFYILLINYNIITTQTLIKYKKILYYILLIIYAFLTPPDLLSLFITILPIIFILEIFLYLKILYKNYIN